jgi:hypothetical protein
MAIAIKQPKTPLPVPPRDPLEAQTPPPARTVTKTADKKGRLVLGGRFANRAIIVQWVSDTEVVLKLARVIPESEAWLYDNAKALASVRAGLAQARAGEFADAPDLAADTAEFKG